MSMASGGCFVPLGLEVVSDPAVGTRQLVVSQRTQGTVLKGHS